MSKPIHPAARDRVEHMTAVMRFLDSLTANAPNFWNPILREDALRNVEAALRSLTRHRQPGAR